MRYNEQELWQRARKGIRRAQRHLDAAKREYERIKKIRKDLEQLTAQSEEDVEF